jgi:hypothetical protein
MLDRVSTKESSLPVAYSPTRSVVTNHRFQDCSANKGFTTHIELVETRRIGFLELTECGAIGFQSAPPN